MTFKLHEENPCRDCTERHVGCHGKCSKYTEWKAKVDKALLLFKNERALENDPHIEIYMRNHPREFVWKKR